VPTASGAARRAVREFCRAAALPTPLADDAELLTSELVTNAVRHAKALITVLALQQDGSIVVTVSDDGELAEPLTAQLPEATAECGRGMFVVAEIAGAWGTTEQHDGKTVWFRLP
jgi:anti-sigma regulatory factor (Ser/Thr protein kinase)